MHIARPTEGSRNPRDRSFSWLRNRVGAVGPLRMLVILGATALGLVGVQRNRPITAGAGQPVARPVTALLLLGGDTTVFYGEKPDTGSVSPGRSYVDRINIPFVAGRVYKIRLRNGTSGGANRVTSAVTKWNGFPAITAADLTSGIFEVTKTLASTLVDTLKLTVIGPANSYVNVVVYSVSDPTFTIFGENTYNIPSGTTKTYTPTFPKPATAAATFNLFVTNGDSLGNRITSGSIMLNGANVIGTTDFTNTIGSFQKQVTVAAGTNTLSIVLNGTTGKFIKLRVTATDTTAPAVTITTPIVGTVTNATSATVTGTLTDQTTTSVSVNGVAAAVTGNTSYTVSVPLPTEGANVLTATATDVPGKTGTATRNVTRDTQAPTLTVAAPLDSTYVQTATITVNGTVSDATTVTVNTNGTNLPVVGTTYTGSVSLAVGSNTLITTALDLAGNTTSISRFVARDATAPVLTVTTPTNGTVSNSDSILVTGTVTDASPVTVAGNGVNLPVVSGNYSGKVPLSMGANTINVVATDRALNATTVPRTVTRQLPPDPTTVAPALNQTVVTAFNSATSFLYSGTNPIQTGVTPGTISVTRAAVIRGKVVDSVGASLSGVDVSVLGHSEYGSTISRSNGQFDLAVNGGGLLTVKFTKLNYLPAQRGVQVPWQDFVAIDSVAMLQVGPIIDSVHFGQPMQVVRLDSVNDVSGGRRPTLMFRDSTVVTATLPGGGTQVITGPLAIRAKEFTVGTMGPARMPAALPPTSAYTYAIELDVDSAMKLSATKVTFSKPVPVYVDDYMGFPVGAIVPAGSYDAVKGIWVTEPDGRIIKVLSISSGLANLAIDSAGTQATPAQLAAIGIDSLERTRIATTYPTAGKLLTRVAVDHFSIWDLNHGERLPADATGPNGAAARPNEHLPNCKQAGSIIGCENQTLGEALPLTGTPYSLVYQSDRVPGYSPEFGIDIPLRGDTIPPSVQGIFVDIEIAGQHIKTQYPRSTKFVHHVWDGKDAYGRFVQGRVPYTIGVGFIYNTQYYVGMLPGGGGSFGGGGGGGNVPTAILNPRQLQVLVTWRGFIGPWNVIPQGLGGWTISAHHSYDPTSRVLHLGTGEQRSAQAIGNVMQPLGGTGVFGFSGDGGPALAAKLFQPSRITTGPDGSVYVSDQGNQRIRKIAPDGTIATIAGDGTAGFSGDGGPATSAHLSSPLGIALGSDGSVYVADQLNNRVRKVDPLGTISTVAGTGTSGYNGDGIVATTAQLAAPYDVDVAPDGSLYIADNGNHRIRRVMPNGYIYTIAGNPTGTGTDGSLATSVFIFSPLGVAIGPDGSFYFTNNVHQVLKVDPNNVLTTLVNQFQSGGFSGDGGPAKNALLFSPNDLAVGPDGSVYVADFGNDRIRRIGPTGIISTVAGNGQYACSARANHSPCVSPDGDGFVGMQASLHGPHGVAVDADGSVYIADDDGDKVRKIGAAYPGASPGTMLVASGDGGTVYEFDANGKHQRTLDALLGTTVLTFSYDTGGRLVTITDLDSNITSIQRSVSGLPQKIVAPFGQATVLATDLNGLLSSVANPGGEVVRLFHRSSGLLDSLADPKGQKHRFTYDSLGQLSRDDDPAGGFQTLTRTTTDSSYAVLVTSGGGKSNTYLVEHLSTGLTRRTQTNSAGQNVVSFVESGIASMPDSSTIVTTLDGDPRWGQQSPSVAKLTVTLPSGLTAVATGSRHDSLSVPGNPFSLFSKTDTVSLNGNPTTSVFIAASRQITQTSPLGRQVFSTVDAKGRVISTHASGLDSVRFTYDTKGRPDSVVDGGRKTKYTYSQASGRLTSVVDPLSQTTQFAYDSAGRVTARTLPDGRSIQFSYDSSGNLTSLTPPGRPAHGFQYTSVDLAKQYDPPGIPGAKPTKYFYNLDRQVDSIVRPDSIAVKFTYDGAGRLTSVLFDRGTQSFGYSSTSGSLTSLRTPTGDSLKFRYNGSLPTAVVWKGTLNDSVTVAYDSAFRVKSQTVHGGSAVTFGYDNDGLLTSAGALKMGRSLTNGLLLADTLNRVRSAYSYTTRGELKSYRVERAGTLLFGAGFVRDSLGRITAKTDTVNGTITAWSFAYDSVGRLKSTTQGTTTRAYEYDLNGNRSKYTVTGSGTLVATYDNQDRLLTYGTTSYTYGSNGELKTKVVPGVGTTSYTYDALGSLTHVVLPSGAVLDYLIDGENRRVGLKLNGTLQKSWIYQDQLNPIAELDGSGNLVSRFVYGSRANVPDYMLKGGNVYRLISDHLGSVRLVVDTATGTIAQRIDYDEFGVATVVSGAGFQPFGFAGGLTDSATTLVRFGARDYDPQVGRWTSKDQAGFAGGALLLYSYVQSEPVNGFDPTGMCRIEVRSTPVLLPARHAYIITTDLDGSQKVFRGGPLGGCPGISNPFGDINAQSVPYNPKAPDWDPGNVKSVTVENDGLSCAPYDNVLYAVARGINAAGIAYNPIGANSNSTVRAGLDALGFPQAGGSLWERFSEMIPGLGWLPGWRTPLRY